jgi:hypothetical protein
MPYVLYKQKKPLPFARVSCSLVCLRSTMRKFFKIFMVFVVAIGVTSSGQQIADLATPGSTQLSFNQANTFKVGDILRRKGANFIKAQANNDVAAKAICVVTVATNKRFTCVSAGFIGKLSGLIPGASYFLSVTTPGAYTATEPTGTNQISKPIFTAISNTTAIVNIQLGIFANAGAVLSVAHVTDKAEMLLLDVSVGSTAIWDDGSVYTLQAIPSSVLTNWVKTSNLIRVFNLTTTYSIGALARPAAESLANGDVPNIIYQKIADEVVAPAGTLQNSRRYWAPYASETTWYNGVQASIETAFGAVPDYGTFSQLSNTVGFNTPVTFRGAKNWVGRGFGGTFGASATLDKTKPILTWLVPAGTWGNLSIEKAAVATSGGGKHAMMFDVATNVNAVMSWNTINQSRFVAATVPSGTVLYSTGNAYAIGDIVSSGGTVALGPWYEKISTAPAGTPVSDGTAWKIYRAYAAVFDNWHGGVLYNSDTLYHPGEVVGASITGPWYEKISLASAGTTLTDNTAWEAYDFITSDAGVGARYRANIFGLTIENSQFSGGLRLIGIGDSNNITNSNFTGSNTGITIQQVADTILRSSSAITLTDNNITAKGGIWIKTGQNILMRNNNFELNVAGITDQPTDRRAIINIMGSPTWPTRGVRLEGGHAKVNVVNASDYVVIVDNAIGAYIGDGFRTKKMPNGKAAIWITPNAKNTIIGDVIFEPSTDARGGILDDGQGTKGVYKDVDFSVAGLGTLTASAASITFDCSGTSFTAQDVGKMFTASAQTFTISTFVSATGPGCIRTGEATGAAISRSSYTINHFKAKAGKTDEDPQFVKSVDGMVSMIGQITGAGALTSTHAAGTAMFKMPAGFRPAKLARFGCVSDNNTVMSTCEVEINPTTGEAQVFRNTVGNAWFSLNQIRFFAPDIAYPAP